MDILCTQIDYRYLIGDGHNYLVSFNPNTKEYKILKDGDLVEYGQSGLAGTTGNGAKVILTTYLNKPFT